MSGLNAKMLTTIRIHAIPKRHQCNAAKPESSIINQSKDS